MPDIAIRVEKLSKLCHIGARQQRHDTLRDSLGSLFRRASHPQADDTDLWALRDVSFEVKRGEVVSMANTAHRESRCSWYNARLRYVC